MYLDDIKITGTGDITEPVTSEWGVKDNLINLNTETGGFDMTVTAGDIRYNETTVYVALYNKNGVLESVKVFKNPEFDENSEFKCEGVLDMPDDTSDITIKAFIWRETMKPITNAIPLQSSLS